MVKWTNLTLEDADGAIFDYNTSCDQYISALDEYRRTGSMDGIFFANCPDDVNSWEWGPASDEIDWTGFPE